MNFFNKHTAKVMDCKLIADQLKQIVKEQMLPDRHYALNIFAPNTPDNNSYIKGIKKDAQELGIDVCECSSSDWEQYVHDDPYIVMFGRENWNENYDPDYDVDGRNPTYSTWYPCTATAVGCVLTMWEKIENESLAGKHIVVIGRGETGNGIVRWLRNKTNATVTQCNSHSHLDKHCKTADVIISAAGVPNLVTKKIVKSGAVIIDVGVSVVGGKVVGDVNEDVKDVAEWITTVPGGIGLVTRASLLHNVVQSINRVCDKK